MRLASKWEAWQRTLHQFLGVLFPIGTHCLFDEAGMDEDFSQGRFVDDTLFLYCWGRHFKASSQGSTHLHAGVLPPMLVHASHVVLRNHPAEDQAQNLGLFNDKLAAGRVCNDGPVLRAPGASCTSKGEWGGLG